ncbi:MAG: REP element-mobilizing transposase RayT [Cognaticolwellia sp.]|jgi:REP element-mobilizing transposase RayT
MSRKPRHFLANVPCHVISRGNNHNVCFFADADYQKIKGVGNKRSRWHLRILLIFFCHRPILIP